MDKSGNQIFHIYFPVLGVWCEDIHFNCVLLISVSSGFFNDSEVSRIS